jgi:hypothetical protein
MTRDEAIARARAVAEEQGWPWHESVRVTLEARGGAEPGLFDSLRRVFGAARPAAPQGMRKVWHVVSAWGGLPAVSLHAPAVVVVIDDESGGVLQKFYQPR